MSDLSTVSNQKRNIIVSLPDLLQGNPVDVEVECLTGVSTYRTVVEVAIEMNGVDLSQISRVFCKKVDSDSPKETMVRPDAKIGANVVRVIGEVKSPASKLGLNVGSGNSQHMTANGNGNIQCGGDYLGTLIPNGPTKTTKTGHYQYN